MNEQNRNDQKRQTSPRPAPNRANPPQNGQRPQYGGQRPPQGNQRPIQNGQRSPQRPQQSPRRPVPPRKEPEAPPRRRNEESYVFSRSLSETRERILTERRERLEDARRFRREDVRDKLRKGFFAFGITLLLIIIATTVIVSVALNRDKVKKNKGEFIYKIGTKETELAYADAVLDGTVYISMNSLSELCSLTLSGSTENDLRFYTEDGDWISFAPNSSTATVNGYGMPMPAPAKIRDTECSVPAEFLNTVLGGVTVSVDTKENTVTVKRIEYSDSTPLEPHYTPVSFMLKTGDALASLDENKYFAGQPLFSFHNDLTEYESCMNPEGEYRDAFLLLVNRDNPVEYNSYDPASAHYTPEEHGVYKEFWLEPNAGKALEAMMLEMKSAGFKNVFVTSGYRSYNYQTRIYNGYIADEMAKDPSLSYEEAQAIVDTYSAVPGYSEHQTGLCVDFMITDMVELTNEFADREVYDWLCANAWKFGFILRYPEDKVGVTGYSYESWHWRFVGRTHALAMLRSGMCFEEYLASMVEAH